MADIPKKPSFFSRRILLGATVGGALLLFIAGIVFWGGFNTAMEATNEMEFCINCHEMEENVYQEYKPTIHYSNRTGVRATCPDCHVPRPWIHKIIRKIQASNEVYHKIMGTVDTPEKFDEHRLTMAKRVWKAMKTTDSRECRNCHNFESMNPKFQRPRARNQHLNAFETGQTCIDCHKGIAHKPVRKLLSDEELEAVEAPNPEYIREVPEMYLAGMKEIEAIEAEQAAKEKEAKQKARERKTAAKQAEKARTEKAVADALAAYKAQAEQAGAAATAVPAAVAAAARGFGVDWNGVPSREITLLYPGQTSMEWMLTGKDHGGARPFMIGGDRCTTCHDKEAADMGRKMVTGEKAEPTPIPGKRGGIPVTVQAAHDTENLYLRFEWEDTAHVPVPFVEGGKMDPENPIKLAVMLATNDVEYADQAGCWGTCHHDLRSMPHAPEADAMSASPAAAQIDLSQGVTKYIKESRSKIEVKGRRGKKRGGWDKLKSPEELKTELDAHKFMELLRFKSGKGETEDGYILEQRTMSGGQGFEVDARQESGNWTVVMKRKLKSDQTGDLSLALDQVYNFGFAIHDDYSDARFHHVSLGYKLGFDNESEGVEVNAVQREAKAAAAPAATPAPTTAAVPAAAAAAGVMPGAGVDWSKAGSREITLLYPGQTSMEWVMTGKDHGGARPFMKGGDRCTTCHDKEAADMGKKMVTGAKAEPTPIPDKRAAIPVTVESTHDGEHLYLRFSWEEGEHAPVPFVEGGKMDPDNPMKFALMFATDEVEYADRSGCWGTCHHDARTMPHAPEADAMGASPVAGQLDLSEGVTKYTKESRSKIEVKGRRGKKRGGWDKLKGADELKSEMDAGRYMDLARYKSGKGEVENGHILEQRTLSGAQGAEMAAENRDGIWTLVMKRKLNPGASGDLDLAKEKLYNFGFAIHDDYSNARFHHVSLGYKLGFDNEEAEVNAIAQ